MVLALIAAVISEVSVLPLLLWQPSEHREVVGL